MRPGDAHAANGDRAPWIADVVAAVPGDIAVAGNQHGGCGHADVRSDRADDNADRVGPHLRRCARPLPADDRLATDRNGSGASLGGLRRPGPDAGPYEDGGFVIDATGPARGCRVQVSLAKMGTATVATILFGAACPFR